MEFTENYATVIQDKTKAAHWAHAEVKIFTSYATYHVKHQLNIIVSGKLNHGKHAVWKYLDILIQDMKKSIN